jgi:hypothetical protein
MKVLISKKKAFFGIHSDIKFALSFFVSGTNESRILAGLTQENGFGSAIIAQFGVSGERRSNCVHLQKRV